MLRVLIAVLAAAISGPFANGYRQTPPPDTEIFLATLSIDLAVGRPVNVTNSPGYDNQPSFTPDGRAMLFASARAGGTATDIYRYEIATQTTTRVTETPEAEYSPTITPDGKHISVVRVEADGTQRLWQFTLDGKNPSLVLRGVKPVGYHAWIDASTLALFVLGQPATLQVADVKTGQAHTVAAGIGRSIQRIPGGGISYVARQGTPPIFSIRRLSRTAGGGYETRELTAPPVPTADPDVAWTPSGTLLVASTGGLHAWKPGDPAWKRVADLDALGLGIVTRLAVSPSGERLALVARAR